MSLTLLQGFEPRWYTLENDRTLKDKRPAQFLILPLSRSQMLELGLLMFSRQGIADYSAVRAEGVRFALVNGIGDWRNVHGPDGRPVEFTPAKLEDVPPIEAAELARAVWDFNCLSEDQAKNSDSPSSSAQTSSGSNAENADASTAATADSAGSTVENGKSPKSVSVPRNVRAKSSSGTDRVSS